MGSIDISIIGAGGFGLALANLFSERHSVTLWVHSKENYQSLTEYGGNDNYLKDVKINKNVSFTMSVEEAAKNKNVIIISVPSFAFTETCNKLSKYAKESQIIIIATKGLERESGKTMSEAAKNIMPNVNHILTISGPSHAEEVAKGLPTAVVIADSLGVSEYIRDYFMMPPKFRVYSSSDQKGVEIGGALKNIIAIAGGIVDGLRLGDNAKAALITRGLIEMKRFVVHKGGLPETIYGLSGAGDLIVTCSSKLSRNNRLGFSLAKGKTYEQIQKENHGQVAEGVYAVQAAQKYAKKNNISMPITNAVYDVLFNKLNPKEAIKELMGRTSKDENE